MKRLLPVLATALWLSLIVGRADGAGGKAFTVAEDIELAYFGDPYTGQAEPLQFSPDGTYFAALAERGRADLDRPEATLRIYRTQDVLSLLGRHDGTQPPAPSWTFSRSTDKDGPLITHWRWLEDSSGIAFLERHERGQLRLALADLKTKSVAPLTPDGQDIRAFDIRDQEHYVYAVADSDRQHKLAAERETGAIVATGRDLIDLLFHEEGWFDRSQLWAVIGDKRFQVKDQANGQPIVLFNEGQQNLALSPDGESLVTSLPVPEVPVSWEELYPPSFARSPIRLHAGSQDLATFNGSSLVSRYVRIELASGTARALSDAPTGFRAGWAVGGGPAWSQDGNSIVLPNAFVASPNQAVARACVAVANLRRPEITCVEPIEGPSETGAYSEKFRYIDTVRFEGLDGRRLHVSYASNGTRGSTEYHRSDAGVWAVSRKIPGAEPLGSMGLEVTVAQGLNEPPVLRATNVTAKISRMIWDPNPQLKDIALTSASIYRWRDKSGRDWKGGLFKPAPFEAGRRYPLVIQTHGFSESEFRPSGVYPTAFAAQALSGAGMIVLQSSDCSIIGAPEEGPCNVEGYEAAVAQLVKDGLVDPDRIGIVGFSRTCFYVMEALTSSALRIKAASVTDGVVAGYHQYISAVDITGVGAEYDSMIGARPFGEGLQQWLNHAPLFNVDKVTAPLQVVALGRFSLLMMWEPYAAMRYLHKPVDLILINNSDHVLSNPAARLASQGGTVDWFRFWLKGEEDPDPRKAEQFKRWRELRTLKESQDAERAMPGQDSSSAH